MKEVKIDEKDAYEVLKALGTLAGQGNKYQKVATKIMKQLERKPITVSSRKAKGRDFQKWVCDFIGRGLSKAYNRQYTSGAGDNVEVGWRPMGQAGSDIILRGNASVDFPFDIECKNQNIFSFDGLWQSQARAEGRGLFPALVYKRNKIKEPVIVMTLREFFDFFGWAMRLG
jgi:hypothetical protein